VPSFCLRTSLFPQPGLRRLFPPTRVSSQCLQHLFKLRLLSLVRQNEWTPAIKERLAADFDAALELVRAAK